MSIEAHPNIQAVGFTMDINSSMKRWLRGDAEQLYKTILSNDELKMLVVNFVVDISTRIDKIVETERRK